MGNDYELSDMIRDVPWNATSYAPHRRTSAACRICPKELKNRGVTIDDKRKVRRPHRRLAILSRRAVPDTC